VYLNYFSPQSLKYIPHTQGFLISQGIDNHTNRTIKHFPNEETKILELSMVS